MWMQQACGLVIILATFFEIIIIMHLYSAFRPKIQRRFIIWTSVSAWLVAEAIAAPSDNAQRHSAQQAIETCSSQDDSVELHWQRWATTC